MITFKETWFTAKFHLLHYFERENVLNHKFGLV